MSSEKNKVAKIASENKNLEENEVQQGGSLFGTLVRGVLILALVFYMLKPYLFDRPTTDSSASQIFVVHGKTMGTTWNARVCSNVAQLIDINNESTSETNDSDEQELVDSCEALLARLIQHELDKVDSLASTYRDGSEISKFNKSTSSDWFPVSQEVAEIVSIAQDVAKKTEGAFDITVAPLVNLYRFGPNKAPIVELPSDEEINKVREKVGYEKLEARLDPPALRKTVPELSIDLSGVAKGFAVDLVCKALDEAGLTSYMVEVGGEIRCRGSKTDPDTQEPQPWTLGVQTPEIVADSVQDVAPDVYRFLYFDSVDVGSVLATSGDYQNYLQVGSTRFSHIVDPRTGKPTEVVDVDQPTEERLGSVSIVSTSSDSISCAQADAYATAFFVLGVEKGVELANKLGVPALYLLRADDSASSLREVASTAFASSVNSKTYEELEAQNAEQESLSEKGK